MIIFAERWLSGRKHRTRNAAWVQAYRGFESHPLRHDPRTADIPLKIYFDGGCRPNPGEMQVAVVARGVVHHLADLGPGSSEQAEWLALLHGLRVADMIGEPDIVLLGDAAGVIGQVNGTIKCRNASFLEQFQTQAATFERVRLRFVRRNQNLAGIALAKLAER